MMFTDQILLFATVVGLAAANVPSYIHTCSAKDPKLDECVINSVNSLRDRLRKGIPELDVPPVEPLKIDKVQLSDLPNFKAVGMNINVFGLSAYRIKFLHLDLKKQQLDIEVEVDEIKLTALYNINAKILVPIVGSGPITLVSKNVGFKVRVNYKLVERDGGKYIYFHTMTTQLDIKDFDVKFDADSFDKTLREAIIQTLGNSHQEVLDATKPNIEKAISETVLNMANKICMHFTFDELLPDRG